MELQLDGKSYRIERRMDTLTQDRVLRRLAGPGGAVIMSLLFTAGEAKEKVLTSLPLIGEALGAIGDDAAEYVITQCLSTVDVSIAKGAWAPLATQGAGLMYNDPTVLPLFVVYRLVVEVVQATYAGFFQQAASGFKAPHPL